MKLQKITIFFEGLFQSFFSIVKIVILSKWFVNFKKHGSNETECVILANGPSLTKDLEKHFSFINSKKKFCVNFFALSKEYISIKPDYYILAAPEYWLTNITDFFRDQRNRLIENLVNTTDWKMKLFIPFAARRSEFCSKLVSNKNIEVVFYNNTPVEGFQFVANPLFKTNLGMPRPHNVLVPSIYLALNVGFKKIILFGADHSWHEEIKVDNNNNMTVNHEHFYDKIEVRMPMYKLDGGQYFLHDVLRKLYLAFKGYFVLSSYSEYLNAKIVNAGSKSYIDAFEKININ